MLALRDALAHTKANDMRCGRDSNVFKCQPFPKKHLLQWSHGPAPPLMAISIDSRRLRLPRLPKPAATTSENSEYTRHSLDTGNLCSTTLLLMHLA